VAAKALLNFEDELLRLRGTAQLWWGGPLLPRHGLQPT